MRDVVRGVEFELDPFRRPRARMRAWVAAKRPLDRTRKAKVEPVFRVQVRELATADEPRRIRTRADAGRPLHDPGETIELGAQLFDDAHARRSCEG